MEEKTKNDYLNESSKEQTGNKSFCGDGLGCANTDKEIWRETEDDYYAPSMHATKDGKIGINVGGSVFVKDIREWHKLASESAA